MRWSGVAMIINVRGTSGTGKSTVMREVMKGAKSKTRVMRDGRRQPFGYLLQYPGKKNLVAVIGHYETPCGGCDTIQSYEEIYDAVRKADDAGYDVLYEGLLISGEHARPTALHNEGRDIRVIGLSTPLDVCIDSINQRRWAKNPDKPPVKERNTIAKARAVEIAMQKMTEAGLKAVWRDRSNAIRQIKEWLNV